MLVVKCIRHRNKLVIPTIISRLITTCRKLLFEQRVNVEERFSYSVHFNEMARPAGLEPAAFCLEAMQHKTLSAAAGVAYEGARHLSRP